MGIEEAVCGRSRPVGFTLIKRADAAPLLECGRCIGLENNEAIGATTPSPIVADSIISQREEIPKLSHNDL